MLPSKWAARAAGAPIWRRPAVPTRVRSPARYSRCAPGSSRESNRALEAALTSEADLLSASAAARLYVIGPHFAAPCELRRAEGRLHGSAHLARRQRGELRQRVVARRLGKLPAP